MHLLPPGLHPSKPLNNKKASKQREMESQRCTCAVPLPGFVLIPIVFFGLSALLLFLFSCFTDGVGRWVTEREWADEWMGGRGERSGGKFFLLGLIPHSEYARPRRRVVILGLA